ncbi:MAG TPA: GNAT family N-acetyltransferase [Actinomycetota bacterium]|nr:GNAT family N-acetyltransferase [Actinomycetota bacterium]
MSVEVRPLTVADAEACDAIVRSLPYHFGHEGGRADCAAAVRRDAGLVAVQAGEVVGFLTFVPRFDETAEITWMAVRDDRRRRGVGHALIAALEDVLRADGRRYLALLTVSPNDPDPERPDGYGATRAFYRSAGFSLVRDLPREWESDAAVLMIKRL